MTIHSEHPFVPPEGERDPLRRLRGRIAAPVTVWATGDGTGRRGLTVSSVMIADGEPPRIVGLVDGDSELWVPPPEVLVINLLGASHRFLADAFAGLVPAPGGPFKLGAWHDTAWGPALDDAAGWLGVRVHGDPRTVGWRVLVEAVVEHVDVGTADPLIHLRGRYLDPGGHSA